METTSDERTLSVHNEQQSNDKLSRCDSNKDSILGSFRRFEQPTNCWDTCKWLLPAFIVFYSFIKEIKVGEPFLFKYQTEYLNLTRDQLKGRNACN